MNKHESTRRSALRLTCALVAAACLPSETAIRDAAYRDVLSDGGVPEVPEDRTDVTTDNAAEETGEDGERYICVDRNYSIERAPLDYATFDPSTEVIYPGSLLQGKSLAQPTPEPIAVKRAGGTVTIDLVNGSEGVSAEVEEVSYSSIQTALNDIIAQNNGQGAARFTFESSEVQSREQLALALGVNVSTLTTDFNADIAFSSDTELNRWVVKLTQSYFTMTYDLPTSLDDVFAPSVTPEDLARYVGPGNPAAYVSSVTYGRIFYLLVETTASRKELEASVSGSYQAAVVGGSLDADVTYVSDLAEAKIKVFALGGDPSKALATFSGSYESVRDFLTQGGDLTTGRPLSYKLRSVNTNETVYVKVATDYTVRECLPVDLSLPSPIAWYSGSQQLELEQAGVLPNAIKSWGDAWGDPAMRAVPTRGYSYGGWVLPTTGAGTGVSDVVGFTRDTTGDYRSGSLSFPGQTLRNTDYTVFMTVQSRINPDNQGEIWTMWGNNDGENQGLTIGFASKSSVLYSHGPDSTLVADLDIDAQAGWHLITARFSQEEGMKLYINGQLKAEDASLTSPLLGFSGSEFGCYEPNLGSTCNPDEMQFRDITIVGEALDDRAREDAETVMLVKYRI